MMHSSAKRKIQVSISSIALAIVLLHVIFPKLGIDAITVTLLIVGVIPWLAPLFKSLELPGGLKVEYQDLEKVSDQAIKAGLIAEEETKSTDAARENYSFMDIADTNQELALAGLRIELEKALRNIAKRYSVEDTRLPLTRLIQILANKSILGMEERTAILDMITTLNQASHGVEYDPRTADWVIKNGPAILESLDSKLEDRGGRFFVGRSDEKDHWIDVSYNKEHPETNYDIHQNIGKHTELWEKEVDNLYSALLSKVSTEQKDMLVSTQLHWQDQIKLEREFIASFDNLKFKVGAEGLWIIGSTFMYKVRERAMELAELLRIASC